MITLQFVFLDLTSIILLLTLIVIYLYTLEAKKSNKIMVQKILLNDNNKYINMFDKFISNANKSQKEFFIDELKKVIKENSKIHKEFKFI